MSEIEKRVFSTGSLEARRSSDGKHAYIEGRIPYNSRSSKLYERGIEFVEVLAPSAFNRTLSNKSDVKMLWNHNDSEILGSTKAGTLTLDSRADGLYFSCQLPEHALSRFETISRGDSDGVSFAFQVDAGGDRWDYSEELPVRTLTAARLLEISPTPFPAYPESSTTAAMRSKGTEKAKEEEERIRAELALYGA